jgi:hypothetical protein
MPQVDSLGVALSPADDGSLAAVFECHCHAGALRLPDVQPAEATDELWRHTCCEIYAGVAGDVAYREFIWSPSGQWAMYDLSDYRVRDSVRLNVTMPAPVIRFASTAAGWTLQTRIDAAALPSVAGEQIELGVAVVLEAADGKLSYWALRHAATRPDFHRRESFVLRLSDLA